jgi:hypothetical protein
MAALLETVIPTSGRPFRAPWQELNPDGYRSLHIIIDFIKNIFLRNALASLLE